MPFEIEAKFRASGHGDVHAALKSARAERLGAVLETNTFHDLVSQPDSPEVAPAGVLRSNGSALRVRSPEVIDGRPQPATLTFKGAVEPGAFKKREELELPLSDAE